MGWVLPDEIDLGSWRAFQNEAEDDEFLAVLWSRVLKIFPFARKKLYLIKNGDHSLSNKKNIKIILDELDNIIFN